MIKTIINSIRYNLFIRTKKTPNPDFLQFIPGSKTVMGSQQSVDIPNLQTAVRISGLARNLFKVDGVTRVFYGPNYISIAKSDKSDWNQMKPLIYSLIEDHFQSDQPLLREKIENQQGIEEGDSQTIQLIKQILFARIRPTVQDDGGDVKFIEFNEKTGVLKLRLLGSCVGCPSSSATLKNGILKMMQHYVGQVNDVVAEEK